MVAAIFVTAGVFGTPRIFTCFLAGAFGAAVRAEACAAFNEAAFFTSAFVGVALLAMDGPEFTPTFFAAQRLFVASEMAFLPAAESLRFGLEDSCAVLDGS